MRSLLLLVVAAGCGFSADELGSGGGGNGGSEVDAPRTDPAIDAPGNPMIDAAIDARIMIDAPMIDAPAPMWTVTSTMTVPCSGAVVTSTVTLAAGVVYRLRSSGDCVTNDSNGSRGDAEYVGYNTGTTYDTYSNIDNGLAINDTTVGSDKLPTWGSYTATHTYTVNWTGAGSTITAMFQEPNFTNNNGSLTLEILAFQ